MISKSWLPVEQIKLIPFYLFICLFVFVTINCSFFWDKDILSSKQAFWYLENGFTILPPASLDSGHPPIIALILASLWKIFGIHLYLGHLAMLPFALGLVWQLNKFLSRFFSTKTISAALLLIIIDTSLLTQIIVLTGDLITVFFFFFSLNTILSNKRILLIFALTGTCLSSSRGMSLGAVIVIFDLYLLAEKVSLKNIFPKIFSLIPAYVPAFLLSASYILLHYFQRGWITYDPLNSNWAGCFERVGFYGFIKNIFIVCWRLIDFGRLVLWIVAGYFFILLMRKKLQIDRNLRILLFLFITTLLISVPSMLMYKVLSSHRYLICVFLLFAIIVAYLVLEKQANIKLQRILYGFIIVGLLSGNFWVYPDSIAKGWDATLAHIPYYKLRKEMIHYIDEQKIPFSEVGSEVPNVSKLKFIDLSNDERAFPLKEFNHDKYIFYSNVFNEFTDEEIKELKEKWIPVKELKMLTVRVTLYQSPKSSI